MNLPARFKISSLEEIEPKHKEKNLQLTHYNAVGYGDGRKN